MNARTIPNKDLIPNIARLLDEGIEVTLRAKGRSMFPYIKNDKDELVLRKIDVENISKEDVVLARVGEDHFVIHRIIAISGERILLKGDGNVYGCERCSKEDVLGKLAFIERNGKRIDCNTRHERLKAHVMSVCFRTTKRVINKIRRMI